jgi:hypothetical protein
VPLGLPQRLSQRLPLGLPQRLPLGVPQRLPLGLSQRLRLGGIALSRLFPSAAETSALSFRFPVGGIARRFLAAGALFAAGLWLACFTESVWLQRLGFAVLLAGHVPLWVRTQSNAPGGATPAHEEVWVPVEDAWLDRVLAHERRGERWDTTPWDVSNRQGKFVLILLLAALAGVPFVVGTLVWSPFLLRVAGAVPFIVVPLWFNGMRTTWNPSELRKKGEALAAARAATEAPAKGLFDFVPMLALREGRRGRYPVDARLMLRPSREDTSGFLGVQVQVSINSVQGVDYPYLYAVVLGKGGFTLPGKAGRRRVGGVDLVSEFGEKEGVHFNVIRQHADKGGGWHTEKAQIDVIVAEALRAGREAWRANGGDLPA